MPRISRLHLAGDRHHVTNRASLKRPVFLDDHDRSFFLWILREFNARFDVEVEAYCLMTTHYHLLLACPLDDLAKAMHRLGFLYTQYFNSRYEVDGPLFSDRFYSNPVNHERYHRNAVRYIHRNPLAIDDSIDLGSYRWSSHGTYIGTRASNFVVSGPTLELFGSSAEVFRDFVEDPSNDITQPDLRSLQEAARVVTSTMSQETSSQRELVHRFRMRLVCLVALERLARSSADVASELQMSPSGVRSQASRARSLLESDERFLQLYVGVIDKIGPVIELPSWWSASWDP